MIRCLAVDDEAYAAEIIAHHILKTPFLTLVGTTTSPIEALEMVREGLVDLVFLDIQMPELSGIQFLKICDGKCKVILTTAYTEYAIAGFDLDVVDYLLKPVAYDRFYKAAQKAKTVIEQEHTKRSDQTYMFIKGDAKNKFIRVNFDDILYIEGLKNYLSIYTLKERIVVYQSLKAIELQLPSPPFYRIHKSYLVSASKITMVDGNMVYINNQALPIGETYRETFFKAINKL
ncbi:MAG: response regulator transcription factor [Pedobacter sp.]|nr:MAG: response regulator transcription factor [Pedobacter sp.]